MSVGKLAAALSVLFVVFLVALAAELLYVLWRHRSFRRRSSPIRSHDETPITDAATKELLFFCLKPHTAGAPPTKDKDQSSPDDHVVDVFKSFDAKDKEEVKSKPLPDVDFLNKTTTKISEVVGVTVDQDDGNTKTVCDSRLFFTPVGSPSRDFMESEFVDHEIGKSDDI